MTHLNKPAINKDHSLDVLNGRHFSAGASFAEWEGTEALQIVVDPFAGAGTLAEGASFKSDPTTADPFCGSDTSNPRSVQA